MAADAEFMKRKKRKKKRKFLEIESVMNTKNKRFRSERLFVSWINLPFESIHGATMQLDKFHWHCHGWCDAAVRAICNELREVDATGAATDTRTITNRCQCIRCANLWKILRRHAEHFFHIFLATRLGNTHPIMSVHWDQWNVKRQKERVKSPCCCYPFPSDAGDIVLRI